MSKAIEPAFPIVGAEGFPTLLQHCTDPNNAIGLTKLELFSAMAMQGLLAGRPRPDGRATIDPAIIHSYAEFSAYAARALIDQLEKPA